LFRNGNIYGLTSNGGPCRRKVTCGTAFELTPTGNKALLYSFGAITHGWFPSSGLIEGPGFELYGETDYGGIEAAQNTCGNIRCGTVFVLYGNGKVRVLYDFTGQADGYNPSGGLVRDSEGNLYGVTGYGGGTSCFGGLGCGQVFKISPDGTESAFHAFEGGSDGVSPAAPLIQDSAGNMYGTTFFGGGGNKCHWKPPSGCGTVFKLAADGTETILYSFAGGRDGANPQGRLAMDSAGNLYGTTYLGGDYGYGTVFELSQGGVETVLHSFAGGQDGREPGAINFLHKSRTLVGTTFLGGSSSSCAPVGCGTVFSISPDHKEKILHAFSGGADGAAPANGLVDDGGGNIYGAAAVGGIGYGTIFKLTL
jgi:uncharacterized repeat protein (TIGR03803 family)